MFRPEHDASLSQHARILPCEREIDKTCTIDIMESLTAYKQVARVYLVVDLIIGNGNGHRRIRGRIKR